MDMGSPMSVTGVEGRRENWQRVAGVLVSWTRETLTGRGEGASLTFIRGVVSLLTDGAGGRGGLALSLVLLLVLSLVRGNRNGA